MKILIGCEFSGRVRDAFSKKGHDVMSCDLEESLQSGRHYKGDIRDILTESWDMLIAFPPCTYLCVSGARWFKDREKEQQAALDFVRLLLDAPIPKIAIENPVGVISSKIRKPDQIIQPWWFGLPETKATCLWLKGLPMLKPTNIVEPTRHSIHYLAPGPNRSKIRSITFKVIANAMAEQWG